MDRVFDRAKELEKRPSVVDWTPPRRESSSSDVIESPRVVSNGSRGSMVTLKGKMRMLTLFPRLCIY